MTLGGDITHMRFVCEEERRMTADVRVLAREEKERDDGKRHAVRNDTRDESGL
jgi:hypothetical protein